MLTATWWLWCTTTSLAAWWLPHRWLVAGANLRGKQRPAVSHGSSTPTCQHHHSADRPPPVSVAEARPGSVYAGGRRLDPPQRALFVPKAPWDPALLLVYFMHEVVTRCLHPACFVVATGKPPNSYSRRLPRFLLCRVLSCTETPSPTRTYTAIEVPGTGAVLQLAGIWLRTPSILVVLHSHASCSVLIRPP
jgi:hypothetical protein